MPHNHEQVFVAMQWNGSGSQEILNCHSPSDNHALAAAVHSTDPLNGALDGALDGAKESIRLSSCLPCGICQSNHL